MLTKEKKQQRVSEKDALLMKEKIINEFRDPCQTATCWSEDYAGASSRFINEQILDEIIKRLTR